MKLLAFLMVVIGGTMTYLGITGKKLTVGKWSFGGGSSTTSSTTIQTPSNASVPTQPITGTFFFGDSNQIALPWQTNENYFGGVK